MTLDYDTVNSQLAGSPLWEGIKARVAADLASALSGGDRECHAPTVDELVGRAPIAPVEKRRGPGRPIDPNSKSRRAAALVRAGADDVTVMTQTGASASLCSKVRSRVARGLL